jgi:putative ABC transport system substrate-binding protein
MVWILFITCGLLAANGYAERLAIFDYDDRLDEPDTVAKFIEKKLKNVDQDLTIDQFSGKGDRAVALDVLCKLEKEGYDLIITITSDAFKLARYCLKNTPTIYTNANNPLFLGMKTLRAPGYNISGASYYVPIEKQLTLFKKIQPGMLKVGFILDRANIAAAIEARGIRKACMKLHIRYYLELVSVKEELPEAAENLIKKGVHAIVLTMSDKLYDNVDLLKPACNAAGVPIYSFYKNAVPLGAVASLSSDFYLMAEKLVVPMALKVLKDKVGPGTMPAAFLDETFLYLNQTQAEKLGLKIPPEIKNQANEVY